jgi:uncharacterized cupredoxin-like copper-binding protein
VRPAFNLGGASVVAIALLAATGCGAGRSPTTPGAAVVRVKERDFRISAPKRVAAGDVRLSIRNRGPDDHEFIVVRKERSRLPFRTDGLTIDEEALGSAEAGALEPGEPGSRELRVHLRPGRYVLFCNMSGHYLGGMHTELEVR